MSLSYWKSKLDGLTLRLKLKFSNQAYRRLYLCLWLWPMLPSNFYALASTYLFFLTFNFSPTS